MCEFKWFWRLCQLSIPGWTLQQKYSVSETKISFFITTWKNWAKNGQNTQRPLKSVVVNYVAPGEGSSRKSNIVVYSQHTDQNWYCIFRQEYDFYENFITKALLTDKSMTHMIWINWLLDCWCILKHSHLQYQTCWLCLLDSHPKSIEHIYLDKIHILKKSISNIICRLFIVVKI